MTIDVEVLARRDGEVRCVFCRDELTGAIETCPGCRATFHPACRAEMPRCATIGCSSVRADGSSGSRRGAPQGARAEDAVVQPPRRPAAATPQRRAARETDDDGPGLHQATTPEQLLRWGAGGATVGVVIGLFIAYGMSRHGIEAGVALRTCGIGLAVGAVEGVLVGAVGVRRKTFFSGRGKNNPTTVVQMIILMPCAAAGAMMAESIHVSPLLGGFAAVLLVIPFLLRWLGFG